MTGDTLFPVEEFLEAQLHRLKLPRSKSSFDEAREFGGWTIDKLEILRLYLKMYRRVAGNGSYIDGFAGTGTISSGGETHDGSAAIAVKSGAFRTWRFYERPRVAERLSAWLETNLSAKQRARATVVRGDFNVKVLNDLADEIYPRERPCFAFLDPNSTELHWNTIEALAAYKADCHPPDTCRVELWILFNTDQALMRLMPRTGKPPNSQVLNRWMGSEQAWRDLYEAGKGPSAFARRYAERLESEFGYGLARALAICDPETGRRQYYMIHASDHLAAHNFMRWAAKHAYPESSEARQFPGLDG